MMSVAMRKPEGLKAKMEEMAAIGDSAQSPAVPKYASAPEKIWDSVEECDEALKSLTVPVGYCFGTIDPLLQDYWDSNLYAIMNTKGARRDSGGGVPPDGAGLPRPRSRRGVRLHRREPQELLAGE